MLTTGLTSSLTDEWATPQSLFDQLDAEFGFELDVCASDWNHKTERYFNRFDDGLAQEWSGVCWMNPPYGREISAWMRKAYESSGGGRPLFASFLHAPTRLGGMTMQSKVKFVSCVAESSSLAGMVTARMPLRFRPQSSFFVEVPNV
jgi:hypothetical protein